MRFRGAIWRNQKSRNREFSRNHRGFFIRSLGRDTVLNISFCLRPGSELDSKKFRSRDYPLVFQTKLISRAEVRRYDTVRYVCNSNKILQIFPLDRLHRAPRRPPLRQALHPRLPPREISRRDGSYPQHWRRTNQPDQPSPFENTFPPEIDEHPDEEGERCADYVGAD